MLNQSVEGIIKEAVKALNLYLYDLEYKSEKAGNFLRVFVDTKEHDVTIDDCINLNNILCEKITDDMMKDEYFLEVSSPGAERKLRSIEEINDYLGYYVYIKTYEKIDGVKEFYGDLLSADQMVSIKQGNKTTSILYDKISQIRLAIKF